MQHDTQQESKRQHFNVVDERDTLLTNESARTRTERKDGTPTTEPVSALPFPQTVEQPRTAMIAPGKDSSLLYRSWHCTIDVVFALCGSLALLVILPVVALLITLDSPGPIFYKQERIGYQGKQFHLLKFRSMYIDAETPGEAMWAVEHDERITRVGRLMRAVHLDELPQVFNILRGEMSLIGPRPERAAFVNELEKHLPLYCCRLAVKPGLTGWAQVNYHYANSTEDSRIKLHYDLYYIEHRAFSLDMIILGKTIMEVLACRGI